MCALSALYTTSWVYLLCIAVHAVCVQHDMIMDHGTLIGTLLAMASPAGPGVPIILCIFLYDIINKVGILRFKEGPGLIGLQLLHGCSSTTSLWVFACVCICVVCVVLICEVCTRKSIVLLCSGTWSVQHCNSR